MISIVRYPDFGRLYINGKFICFTLDPGKLSEGDYYVKLTWSPKFKQMLPHIYNDKFPITRGFRIHTGNSLKDSDGCILVGEQVNVNKDGTTLTYSKTALNRIINALGDRVWLVSIC